MTPRWLLWPFLVLVAAVALPCFVGRNHFRVGTGLAVQDRHSGRPVHAGRLDRPARSSQAGARLVSQPPMSASGLWSVKSKPK
jgi:hypothetical protein